MSFIRLSKSEHSKNLRKTKRIAKPKPKPEWDSSINDLDVYKASVEDVAYRKAMHQSKHIMKQHIVDGDTNKTKAKRPMNQQQAAVVKELLLDRQQLQDVLSRSDQMLAVVKDMFGDNPKRYTGFPNVTTAPSSDQQFQKHELGVNEVPELSTRMEALSQSIMDDTALNEDPDGSDGALVYTSKMDLARFRQFLESQEAGDQSLSTIYPPTQNGTSQNLALSTIYPPTQNATSQNLADGSMFCTPPREHNESIALLRTPPSAVNDTKKINRTKPPFPLRPPVGVADVLPVGTTAANVTQDQSASRPNASAFSADLQKVITNLDSELSTLEHSSPPRTQAALYNSDTFSGYTAVLVNAVTKLTRHLKQIDVQLKAEMLVREQLAERVQDLRALVDALTGDLITTQEEYAHVLHEFSRYKQSMESQQNQIVSCLKSAGLWTPMEPAAPQGLKVGGGDASGSVPPTTLPSQDDPITALPHVLPSPHLDRVQLAARAVLLSPPVQKSRLTHDPPNEKKVTGSNHVSQNALPQPALVTVPKPVSLSTRLTDAQDRDFVRQSCTDVSYRQLPANAERTIAQTLPYHPDFPDRGGVTTDTDVAQHDFVNNRDSEHEMNAYRGEGNQRVNNNNGAAMLYGSTRVNLNDERAELANQIAELNRQHEEAERRLESLMNHHWTTESESGVSPSMSSISQPTLDSAQQLPPSMVSKNGAPTQTITVSLPSVDLDTSIVSPAQA